MASKTADDHLISIVVPVYRSAAILPELVAAIAEAMAPWRIELILVCDASPDNSWSVIRDLTRQYAFIEGIWLRKNTGQHNAIMAGLARSRGAVVVVMDDDLQHPPAEIPRLLEALGNEADVCYVNYVQRKHAFWKRLGSRFNDVAATLLLGKPNNLYLSSFKAMKRPIVEQVVKYDGPFAYVDGLVLEATSAITSVDILHSERRSGEGTYNLRRSVSLWLKMATSFSVFPLRVLFVLGSVVALGSMSVIIYVVFSKFHDPDLPIGWASTIAAILFVGGLQMLGLGLVGEYLGRAYMKLNGKPQYVIRETISSSGSFNDSASLSLAGPAGRSEDARRGHG
jgi:undecaprenyl-phosphate 4-deoxy-4-formamido-L-arabinose transferase